MTGVELSEATNEGATMKFRDMTETQRLEWGATEADARNADLAGVTSAEALAVAQANAEARRKAVGATRGQAMSAVVLAQRAVRAHQAGGRT